MNKLDCQQTTEEQAPPPEKPGVAARCGEAIMAVYDSVTHRASSLVSLGDAVAEGFGAVIWRMTLTVILVTIFSAVSGLYEVGARYFDRLFGLSGGVRAHSGQYALGLLLWLAASGGTALMIVKDVDGKWPVLNWFFLGITAGACFILNVSFVAWFVVITGQGTIHYVLHAAAASRRRKAEWLREEERRMERDGKSPGPNLGALYRGVQGFDQSSEDH